MDNYYIRDWLHRLPQELQDEIIELYKHFPWMVHIVAMIESHSDKKEEILWRAICELIKQNKKLQEAILTLYNQGLPPIIIKALEPTPRP